MFHDEEYIDLVNYVLDNGTEKPNRTGTNTIGVFGYQMKFDLRDHSIPLLTTKKMHSKSIIHELLWFLKGDTNIKYLNDNGVTIWDEWADSNGNLGPIYGSQWRKWPTHTFVQGHAFGYEWVPDGCGLGYVDQIAQVIQKLKTNPLDRRLLVSAWNVGEINEMMLPPCHYSFQLYARPLIVNERLTVATQKYNPNDIFEMCEETDKSIPAILDQYKIPSYELSLLVNQRSCDVFLGVPFNIAQYGILLHMFCEVVKMAPGELIWNGGDVHIYTNHILQCQEQVSRSPVRSPKLAFKREIDNIDDFKYEDFEILSYEHHPAIKAPIAI